MYATVAPDPGFTGGVQDSPISARATRQQQWQTRIYSEAIPGNAKAVSDMFEAI
jgi:hypothetical protein